MIARFIVIAALLLFAVTTAPLASLTAQTPSAAAHKQDQARAKFKELTERMAKLMPELQKTEPESSSLLKAGLTFAQEKKLQQRLDHGGDLLRQERWDESLVVLTDLQSDLNKLLELLQNRNADLRKLLEEIARLEAFKNRVETLAKEQHDEKEQSALTEALQKHLADLEQKKAQAQALLAEQQKLREQTNQLGVQAAAEATKPLADKEEQLQKETDKLAKDLEQTEKTDAELKKDAAKAAEKAAEAAKNAEPKAGEPKAGEPKAGEPKAGEPKAGEPKAGEPKAGEPKAGEPKAGEPKEGGKCNCSGSAAKAAQSMGQAQKQLGEKKPESSLKDQDHAIENLKKTVQELEQMTEEARRELLKLPMEQQQKQQEKTQHATDTLAKDMEKSEEQEEGDEQKQTPGKKRVQQAVPKQRAAAGQLKEYKPAKQKQQDAKEDLEAAKKELEDALAQLRQQLVDEVLRALEERFTAMLAVQRELSAQTKTLHGTRGNVITANGELPTALVAKIQGLADGESGLEVEAGDALKLLEEDATTAVFPPMVEELRDQLGAVQKRLVGRDTDSGTQEAQREVEELLTMLINALRKVIEQREGGECKGQCNGKPPLVPFSAELKMLRYLQERVNKTTKEFDGRAPEAKNTAESDAMAKKQARVQELMRRLAEKMAKEEAGDGQ
jgi:hypothetical protein